MKQKDKEKKVIESVSENPQDKSVEETLSSQETAPEVVESSVEASKEVQLTQEESAKESVQDSQPAKTETAKDQPAKASPAADPFSNPDQIAPDSLEAVYDVKGDMLLDETVVSETYKKVAETQKPKSKKKSIIFSLVFLAINIVLVVFLSRSLLKSADASLLDLFKLQGKRLWWFALAIGMLAITLVADATSFLILIKKTTGKFRPWLAYKTTSMGKYYEAVTPLALGMQPGQIVELSKGGISAGVATCIPIMKMIVYNLMNVLLSLVFLLCVSTQIASVSGLADIVLIVFKVLAYIGVIISGGTIFVVILIANSKMVGRSLARFAVRTGYKLKIVKDYRASYNKIMKSVLEFQNSMNYFKKNKGTMFAVMGCIVLSLLALGSLPFTITMALSNVTFASFGEGLWYWLECVARYYICFLAASYIPLPGGTGMMEIAFISMFGSSRFFGTNIVWGFLFWRIISYYLIIAQGMVMVIADTIKTIASTRGKKDTKTGEPNPEAPPKKVKVKKAKA